MSKKDKKHSKISYWYLWSLLALIPFGSIILTALIDTKVIKEFDHWVAAPILSSRTPFLNTFYVFITNFGGPLFLGVGIFICCIFLLWKGKDYYAAAWLVVQSILGALVLNGTLKIIFRRSRPLVETLVKQGGFSFPSGHSMGSLICYGGILFLIVKKYKHTKLRNGLIAFSIAFILIIGVSRIYVGVHFPTDIIGGYSAGAAWLIFSTAMYPTGEKLFHQYVMKEGN